MSDTWTGKVTKAPLKPYADGDQNVAFRIEPGSPVIRKGDVVTITRGTTPPVPPPTPPLPPVPPIPPATQPPPVIVPPTGTERALLGGWRPLEPFARGAIAIDFATMRCWMAGHAQRHQVLEFQLPPMGTGTDINAWPQLNPITVHAPWWNDFDAYPNGLCFWRGKVWAATRVHYAAGVAVTPDMKLFAIDGETIHINLPRQQFGGFVKRGPGLDPLVGCGGCESGGGSQRGPSLATLGGQVLLNYGFPGEPGPNLEHWNERAPREPNYWPVNHVDTWVGWEPRVVNGKLEGRWASDSIWGGGLVLPEGITYWPFMGTGELNYAEQSHGMAAPGKCRNYEYHIDPSTYKITSYRARPDLDIGWEGYIGGQELGPDGKVYFCQPNQWAESHAAIKVFG